MKVCLGVFQHEFLCQVGSRGEKVGAVAAPGLWAEGPPLPLVKQNWVISVSNEGTINMRRILFFPSASLFHVTLPIRGLFQHNRIVGLCSFPWQGKTHPNSYVECLKWSSISFHLSKSILHSESALSPLLHLKVQRTTGPLHLRNIGYSRRGTRRAN